MAEPLRSAAGPGLGAPKDAALEEHRSLEDARGRARGEFGYEVVGSCKVPPGCA